MATLPDDPLYRRALTVEGYPIEAALRRDFPKLLEYAQDGYLTTVKRSGGDPVMVTLSDLIGRDGVLAVTDSEAASRRADVGSAERPSAPQKSGIPWGQPSSDQPPPAPWGVMQIDLTPPSTP